MYSVNAWSPVVIKKQDVWHFLENMTQTDILC